MKGRIEESRNPDLANLMDAMRRARDSAYEEAARHGTTVSVWKDGRIVQVKPKLKLAKKKAA